jgi:hypothetical protein
VSKIAVMNKKMRIWALVISFCAVLVTVGITYVLSNQTLDKQELKEETNDLSSYISETEYMIKQYKDGKITFIYTKTQVQYIAKKTKSFIDESSTKDVSLKYQTNVSDIEKLIIRFSSLLSKVSSSHGDRKIIDDTNGELAALKKEVKTAQKKYE